MRTPTPGTAARMRGLLADVIELIEVRLELASVEAREDAGQLILIAVLALLAVLLFGFGVVFLAFFVTLLFWESQKLVALGAFTAAFLTLALILGALAWWRLRRGLRLFRSSLHELKQDRERLRP